MKWMFIFVTALLVGCGGGSEKSAPASSQAPAMPAAVVAEPPVVFIGDSIIWQWNTANAVPGSVNLGVSGERSCTTAARFSADVVARNPSKVVIQSGINDLAYVPGANVACIIDMAQMAMSAGARVYVGTILPYAHWLPPRVFTDDVSGRAAVAEFNSHLRLAGAANGFTVVEYHAQMVDQAGAQRPELFTDGIHPNAAGYATMNSVLSAALQR